MKTQFTPGPWKIVDGKHIRGGKWYIAQVERHSEARIDETFANARLIAAAPEMLEALKDARQQLKKMREYLNEYDVDHFGDHECQQTINDLKVLISHVEGGGK